jgi:hypothetical protein
MFGWLKRKRGEDSEMERFVMSLCGAPASDLAVLLIVATALRINMRNARHLPPSLLTVGGGSKKESLDAHLKMRGFVREFQKMKQPSDAAGAKIWLYTLDACAVPELRLLGRQMWSELARGFPHVPETFADFVALGADKRLPPGVLDEYASVPPGLEPMDEAPKSAAPTSGELKAISAAAIEDIKAKWIQFDTVIKMKAGVPLSAKIDSFVEPITSFVDTKYPTVMQGPAEALWLILFTAILESGTHPKDEVNRAIGELRGNTPDRSPSPQSPEDEPVPLPVRVHAREDWPIQPPDRIAEELRASEANELLG